MTRFSRGVALTGVVLGLVLGFGAGPAVAGGPNMVLELPFDEGTSIDAYDWSGTGNNGRLSPGVRWTQAGRFGGAASFDGDDRVTVPDSPSLDLQAGFTLMAWVRPRQLNRFQTVIMKDNATQSIPYGIYATRDATAPATSAPSVRGGGSGQATGSAAVAQNAWTHVAGTFDGTAYRLYVNGTLVSTQNGPPPAITQQNLGIGNNGMWPTGEGFDGLIDEVKAWNVPLSAAEIVTAKDTRIGYPEDDVAKPVASFAFDDGAGQVARSSNRNHKGTITGARWTTTARWGKALMFDGVDDMVTVADEDSLDLRDEMTMSAWVKPRTTRPYQVLVIKESPWWRTYSFDVADGGGVLTAEMGNSTTSSWVYGPALAVGRWSHVAYTFDGLRMRLYVNGDKVAESAGTPPPQSDEVLRIGGTRKDDAENFDGIMDEVRLYDEALPIDQVRRDRDTSIVLDAPATWREPGDGSTEPQGLGSPTPSATAQRSIEPSGLSGIATRDRAGAPAAASEAAPVATSGRDEEPGTPEVRATRSGRTVKIAVTGAQAGKLRVTLTARRQGRVGACAGRVRASGRFRCRVALRKTGRRLTGLRAVVTTAPRHGKAKRIAATTVRVR
jgi:hypothetical protein